MPNTQTPIVDPIAVIDAALRGGAAALLALAAVILLRAPYSLASRIGGCLAICGFVTSLSGLFGAAASPIVVQFAGLCANAAVPLFWIFARSWFDDDFKLRVRDVALGCAYVGIGVLAVSQRRGPNAPLAALDLVSYLGGTAFALHAQWSAWRNRSADLVESRRHARLAFVLIVAIVILWLTWSEGVGRLTGAVALSNNTGSVILFAGAFGLTILLIGLRHPDMFPPSISVALVPDPSARQSDPGEAMLTARLDRLMSEERAYRDPNLTIGALAAKLDVLEYKLRRLINGSLGHRNVNEYLNRFRLREVCEALAEPSQAEVPIVTIALDAGFGSLGVFNRTFKEAMTETPSAYRKRRMEGSSPTAMTP